MEALFCDGWYLWPVSEGFKNAIEFWQPYLPYIKLFIYSATLFVAGYNLSKYMDMMAIESLRTIRERLNEDNKNKLHELLLCEKDQVSILKPSSSTEPDVNQKEEIKNITIYDYLGTIELGAIMLKKGMISIDVFYNQFGYRMENIFRNAEIAQSIQKDHKYYTNLIYARDLLMKHNLLDLKD